MPRRAPRLLARPFARPRLVSALRTLLAHRVTGARTLAAPVSTLAVSLVAVVALVVLGALTTGCGAALAASHRDPEVVSLEGALQNRFVTAGESTLVSARLRVVAGTARDAHRAPMNLALVLDTSGSMEGAPIAEARAATRAILDTLVDGDRLAVVTFDSRTEVVLPSTTIDGGQRDALRARIDGIVARGTTDLASGLRVGLEEVLRHYDANGINRIVLLSDGVPNDASSVAALAAAAGDRHIAITTLGLGLEYDETLLGRIAQTSGGRFHFVESPTSVAQVFRDEVLRLERRVAESAVVELTPGPGVHIETVVGAPFAVSGTGVRVAIGSLAEGETRDFAVRLRVDARREGGSVEALDAVLTFDDALVAAGRLERRLFLGARATGDAAELEAGRDRDVERDVASITAAAQTVTAIEVARNGDVERARALVLEAQLATSAAATATDDDALRRRAAQLQVLEESLPSVAESSPASAPARAVREAHDEAMTVLQAH